MVKVDILVFLIFLIFLELNFISLTIILYFINISFCLNYLHFEGFNLKLAFLIF